VTGRSLDALLARLSSDDEFRARVVAEPVRALAEYGVDVRPEDVPERVTLPSKRALSAARARLSRETRDAVSHAKFSPLRVR
jgi:putative modified peptide